MLNLTLTSMEANHPPRIHRMLSQYGRAMMLGYADREPHTAGMAAPGNSRSHGACGIAVVSQRQQALHIGIAGLREIGIPLADGAEIRRHGQHHEFIGQMI